MLADAGIAVEGVQINNNKTRKASREKSRNRTCFKADVAEVTLAEVTLAEVTLLLSDADSGQIDPYGCRAHPDGPHHPCSSSSWLLWEQEVEFSTAKKHPKEACRGITALKWANPTTRSLDIIFPKLEIFQLQAFHYKPAPCNKASEVDITYTRIRGPLWPQ